jgi:hypothetical protein
MPMVRDHLSHNLSKQHAIDIECIRMISLLRLLSHEQSMMNSSQDRIDIEMFRQVWDCTAFLVLDFFYRHEMLIDTI